MLGSGPFNVVLWFGVFLGFRVIEAIGSQDTPGASPSTRP